MDSYKSDRGSQHPKIAYGNMDRFENDCMGWDYGYLDKYRRNL